MYRFIVELCLQLKIRGGKFVMEAQSRTMQCNLQDLGLSRAESGLRRIFRDCRTFGEPASKQTKPHHWWSSQGTAAI